MSKQRPFAAIGDAEYLKILSGYKQRAAVIRWCRKNGIKFLLNGAGWPVTTAAALDRALDSGLDAEPDWGYFYDKTVAKGARSKQS